MEKDPTFPRVTIHDLRNTAASLAISAGANVKAVQRMLGHASAAMTLDVYADLFDGDLGAVAEAHSERAAER
jgi:integrase